MSEVFTEAEAAEEFIANPDPRCDCVHPVKYHDPLTGACLRTNPILGPCPCRATSESTRAALQSVHETLTKYAAAGQAHYGRR